MTRKEHKRLLWQVPFLLFLIIGTILIVRHQRSMPYQKSEGMVFGTFYHITYQCDSDMKWSIEQALKEVDQSLSPFNKQSVISHINANSDMHTDNLFRDVFTLAQDISKETQGAFDITVAPLVNAWGFGFKEGIDPTPQVIDSLKRLIGYEKVSLGTDDTVKKTDPRIMLDCSAIAKGYGCDHVATLLRRHDVENFMVEIGGEVVTCGVNAQRLPWRIGVNKPVDDSLNVSNDFQTILNVTDYAMATSGNYRNFYIRDGKKYAHTIDPATGHPVQHNILSSTVLAKRCAIADAYATAFMVMGLEKAKAVLERHPDLMAYFIYAGEKGENKVWYSPSMKKKILSEDMVEDPSSAQ